MRNQMKEKNGKKGITLIALVITIIVLLILAGVTITTLTGDNGLLQKIQRSKDDTTYAELKEEIVLAWNKVCSDYHLDNSQTKAKKLEEELSNNAKVIEIGDKLNILNYKNNDKTFILDVVKGSIDLKKLSEVEQAKFDETIFNEKNTPLIDEYGNTIIVPKGFKLARESADNVTEGIVIEDATYTDTKGSQFVWIPVSKDNTEKSKIKGIQKTTTIPLGRYTFYTSGNEAGQIEQNKTNRSDAIILTFSWGTYTVVEKQVNSSADYMIAKNIDSFISKTKEYGGFWIGRYEARRNSQNKLTEVSTDNVYNQITQLNAATAAREMYDTNNYFESDLINSFAWDTATLFLQEYDNREYNKEYYSIQRSLNSGDSPSLTGTTIDKICNVYDMASNCFEWTTETFELRYRSSYRTWRVL